MEDNGGGGSRFDPMKNTARKKRSLIPRRPRTDGSSNLFAPPDLFSKISSGDDIPAFDTNPTRKEFSLTHCISRAAESQRGSNDSPRRDVISRNKEDEGDGMISGKATHLGERNRMKLKIGGVSRLAHANGSPRKSSKPVNAATTTNHLEESSEDCHSPLDKKADLLGAENDESMTGRRKQGEPGGSIRKSKRALKKQVSDSDDDSDGEIRFLEKLKFKNVPVSSEGTDSGRRQLKPSGGVTIGENSASEKASDDMDAAEELDPVPDGIEISNEIKRESTMTSRQRALASASGKSTAIEFPDGLPPTTRRKKENLSEMEQQVKKAEAAQRRKVQVEKAARESEAEAIRKILGQDSSRKKREDKIKKRLDEIAQEKAAHEEMAPTSFIRTIMGPSGTTVSFPTDKVPSLFDPKPSGYPPPRENCAGPSCTNPYRYRHSKLKVPLCSLKCYKAIEEQQQQETSEPGTDGTPPV
ncbi:HIT zinc finger and PAPA-1-like domain-containing protein [Hirschfeldia incana]|nr:HIT zinc finger and PAPA-1-like domain-containing protein [Hirschfeldia incana]